MMWTQPGQGWHLMARAPLARCCLQTRGVLRCGLPGEPLSECLLQ